MKIRFRMKRVIGSTTPTKKVWKGSAKRPIQVMRRHPKFLKQ